MKNIKEVFFCLILPLAVCAAIGYQGRKIQEQQEIWALEVKTHGGCVAAAYEQLHSAGVIAPAEVRAERRISSIYSFYEW